MVQQLHHHYPSQSQHINMGGQEGPLICSTSPSSYNSEELATTVWSEPFLNYISEGSVSISTVLFVASPPGSLYKCWMCLLHRSPCREHRLTERRVIRQYNEIQIQNSNLLSSGYVISKFAAVVEEAPCTE